MTNLSTTTLGTLAAMLAFIAGVLTSWETIRTHPSFWVTREDLRQARAADRELSLDAAALALENRIAALKAAGRHDEAKQYEDILGRINAVRVDRRIELKEFR